MDFLQEIILRSENAASRIYQVTHLFEKWIHLLQIDACAVDELLVQVSCLCNLE